MTKWLGAAAMAALAFGACSEKAGGTLMAPETPNAETPAPKGWVSAAPLSESAPAPSVENIPAGDYKLDPAHSTFMFSLSHLGFSNFTLWFDTFSADLKLDPANPSAATLIASVDPASLTVHAPPSGFQEELRGEQYLDAKQFPQIAFKSTAINMTGPNTAEVTGDLTLHGITKPVTLSMTYNGGYVGHVYEPRARIGFSVRGVFKRSDFGIGGGVPKPGANMGVSDDVHVVIESEFLGPEMKDPPKPAAPN
jgi:polyisoprenoid-binding protein YceI